MAKDKSERISLEKIISQARSGELEGSDLSKTSLKKADLSEGKFKGVDFSRSSFKKGNLKGADFSSANLTKADLSECDLTGANFVNADMTGVYAKGAIFDNALMKGVTTKDGNLSNSSFKNTDLSGASLTETIIGKCDFNSTDFSGADLTDSDATDSEWEEVNLSKAILTRTSLQNCKIEKVNGKNISAPESDFSLSSISNTEFSDSKFEGADFANTLLENVDFKGCKLGNALFNVSEHKNVDFTGAEIENASFKSLSGYTEERVMAFKDRGAKVDLFLIRKFFRLLKRSTLAKVITGGVILAVALVFYLFISNPNNWSFEKIDRVALDKKGVNDFPKAISLYEIIIKKFGANHIKVSHAKIQMGHIYILMKDYDKAQAMFSEVIKNYPTLENAVILASMGLADVAKGRKNYDKAIAAFNEIAAKYPDSVQAIESKNRIAKIYIELGNVEKAKQIYEEIKLANAENAGAVVQAEFDIADLLRNQGQNEQALEKYQIIFEANKEDQFISARALSNILQIHVNMDNLEKAQEMLDFIKAKYPEDINNYLDSELFLSNALSSKGKYKEAETRLKNIYTNYSDKMQGYWAGIALVDLFSATGRFDDANNILDELTKRWGKQESFRTQFELKRVRLQRSQKLYAQAIENLTKLLTRIKNPDYRLESHVLLAELYIETKSYDLAKAKYNEILKAYPTNTKAVTSAYFGLSKLHELSKDQKTAIKYCEKIVNISEDKTVIFNAQFDQVRLYKAIRDVKNEKRLLGEMIEMHKDNPSRYYLARQTLAETYKAEGNIDQAGALLRSIADIAGAGQALDALTALVRLYADTGDIEKAEKVSKEIATRFPDAKTTMLNATLNTANSLLQSGQTEKALVKFQQIIEEDKGDLRMRALGSVLHIHVDRRNIEKATEIFNIMKEELALDNEIRINAQLGMANLYRAMKMYPESEKLYRDIIDKNPNMLPAAWAMASLAQAYVERNDFENGEKTYKEMLTAFAKIPPQVVKALIGLGSMEELQRRFKKAIGYYEKAAAAAVDENDLLQARGSIVRLTADLGDVAGAEKMLVELKTSYPDKVLLIESIEFSIANAYAKNRDFDKAIKRLIKIREETKNSVNWGNATMTIADLYHNSGNPDKAIKEYRGLEKRFPNNKNFLKAIQLGIAQIYIRQKEYDKAINQYEKILKNFEDRPTRVQALSALSRIYYDKGIVSKARSTYQRLEKEAGDDPNALYELNVGLGEIARRRGNGKLAVERYTKAYKVAPSDSQKIISMTAIAQIYTSQGNYNKAKQTYDLIEKEFGQNTSLIIDAKLGQASVLRENLRFDEALEIYKKILLIAIDDSTKAKIIVSMAQIYGAQKRLDDAEAAYNEALSKYGKIKSVNLDVKNGLAALYVAKGQVDDALKLYSEVEAIAIDERTRFGAASARAGILMDKGDLDKAESIFLKIIASSNNNPNQVFNARIGVANILLRKGDTRKALNIYKELLSKAKDENQAVSSLNSMAQIYLAQKDFKSAENSYKTIISKYGENQNTLVDAKLGLANVYKEQKLYKKAAVGYNEIINKFGDAIQVYWAYMGLAQIQSEQGLIDEAAKTYTKIAQKFPKSASGVADAKLNMANMLKNTNRRAEALSAYEEIIEMFPQDIQAIWAMQGQAQIYSEAADYEKAERLYDRIIQLPTSTKSTIADAKLGKAGLLAVAGNVEEAVTAYKNLIPDLEKEKALQARTAVAHSYLALKKLDDAEATFKGIIKDYSDNKNATLDAQLGLGELEMNRGNFSKAASLFTGIANSKNQDPSRTNSALQALARALVEQEHFDKIDTIIDRITRLTPDDVNAVINIRMNVANKMRYLKMYDEAIAQLDPIIKKYKGHPQTAWAEHSKAQVLTELQRWEDARALYKGIIEKYHTNQTAIVDAKLNLGQIELYSGNKEKAIQIFQQVSQAYPEFQQSINALFSIAQIYEQAGDDLVLESTYLDILSKYGGKQSAFFNANMGLGNLYVRNRRFSKAITHFKNIYSKYPSNNQSAWAMAGAARAYLEIGDEGQAEALLKEVIEKFPQEKEVVKGAKSTLDELYKR